MHNLQTLSHPSKLLLFSQVVASAEKVYSKKLKEAEENLKAAIQSNEELKVRQTNIDF